MQVYITKLFLALAIFVTCAYSISLYSIDLFWRGIKKTIILDNTITISKDNNIQFVDKEYILTPSQIGIKILGVKHNIQTTEISFDGPISIAFNPWSLSIEIKYDGKGNIVEKPNLAAKKKKNISHINDSYLMNFDTGFTYTLNTKLDFVILKKLLSNPYKIVNYIESIDINFSRLKIDKDDKNIIQVNKSYYSVKADKFGEYNSIDDILKNPPKLYDVSGFIDIVNNNSKISLPTTVFSVIPYRSSFKGNFQIIADYLHNKVNIANILYDSKVRFLCNECHTSFADFSLDINLDLISQVKTSKIDIEFHPQQSFSNDFSDVLLNNPTVKFFLSFLTYNDIRSIIKSKIPQVDLSVNYHLKMDSSFTLEHNKIYTKLNEFFIYTNNGSAIGLKGNVEILDSLDFKLDLNAMITKPRSIVTYWNDYYFRRFENVPNHDPDIVSFNNELNLAYLKEISDYPNSNSDDLIFKISYNSKDINISGNNIEALKDKYFKTKTFCLIKSLKNQKNKIAYIQKVAPEIKDFAKDLLELKLDETKKISEDLWRRLIQ